MIHKKNCNGCAANGMTQCDLGYKVEVKWGGEGEIMYSNECNKKFTRNEYEDEINKRWENKFKKEDEK